MIRNRLAELLAERKLKISRVANDIPNLSRNTITSTAQNDTKMIQIETVNSLCQYLEITPKDFFEFLPFDVKFSAVLNGVKPIIKSNVDENQLLVKNLELDVYAEQTFLKASGAQKKQTFDLMAIQPKPQVLPMVVDGSNPDDNEEVELNISILLGHTTDKESYINQKEPFKHFWNSITPGFKPIVSTNLMSVCSKAIREGLNNVLSSTDMGVGNGFYDPEIDWTHIRRMFNISFSDAYSFNNHEPATMEFVTNSEPFNISDDDLPF